MLLHTYQLHKKNISKDIPVSKTIAFSPWSFQMRLIFSSSDKIHHWLQFIIPYNLRENLKLFIYEKAQVNLLKYSGMTSSMHFIKHLFYAND